MSFTIHRVTQRAHGGDPIRRTTRVDADEASIGRGADCDVQLPDLTIGLRHAVMRITARGRVTVDAVGDLAFESDGRVVRHAEIRVSETPRLLFGSYLLTFSPGESEDNITVTVSQITDGGELSESDSTRKVFSLSPIMFSLRRAAWLMGLFILVASIAAPVSYYYFVPAQSTISPDEQWSVGKLSRGHAFLQHDCEACHVRAFRSIPDSACLSCHQDGLDADATKRIVERVRVLGGSEHSPLPAGDHASSDLMFRAYPVAENRNGGVAAVFADIFQHPKEQCVSCHTDHVGREDQKVSGVRAAPPSAKQVSITNCASCHADLKAHVPETVLIDVADWEHHPDFRPLIAGMGQLGHSGMAQSASLGGAFDTGLRFSHRVHLSPNGDVARDAAKYAKPVGRDGQLGCGACHHPDSEGRGFLRINMPRDCSACHSIAIPGEGGRPEFLRHGHPDEVVAQMRAFYASGRASGTLRLRPGRFGGMNAETSSTSTIPESEIVKNIQSMFLSQGSGAHICAGCHDFKVPRDSNSTVFRLRKQIHLIDRYLPQGGFDHSVREHLVDARGAPTCLQCHAATKSDSLANVMMPGVAQCKTCHGNAASPVARIASSNCTECHGYHKSNRARDVLDDPLTHEAHRGFWKIPDGI